MRLALEVVLCIIAAYSFGVIFNIKGKYLRISAIGGGIAWLSYKLLLMVGMENNLSFFFATICFGVYVEVCARLYNAPSTIMSVCAMIILVPGYGVYNTFYAFLTNDYTAGVRNGISTLMIAGAISLGLVFITTLFRRRKTNDILGKIINSFKKINKKANLSIRLLRFLSNQRLEEYTHTYTDSSVFNFTIVRIVNVLFSSRIFAFYK